MFLLIIVVLRIELMTPGLLGKHVTVDPRQQLVRLVFLRVCFIFCLNGSFVIDSEVPNSPFRVTLF